MVYPNVTVLGQFAPDCRGNTRMLDKRDSRIDGIKGHSAAIFKFDGRELTVLVYDPDDIGFYNPDGVPLQTGKLVSCKSRLALCEDGKIIGEVFNQRSHVECSVAIC